MAALFSAMAVFVFFHVCLQILSLMAEKPVKADRAKEQGIPAAAGASLLLAFSETWWSQATAVEVYSLHVLFLSLILFTFFRAYGAHQTAAGDEALELRAGRLWLVFAFLTGLSFTNHMTTVLLAPALLYLFFSTYGLTRNAMALVKRMSIPFLLGLSLYLYLPLRASQQPLFRWGDPATVDRFFSHLRGKQYSVWIFSSAETASRQFSYFVGSLPGEFAVAGLILALVGFVAAFRRSRRVFMAMLVLFLTCIIYSINYDIHDIDSYFLLAYVSVAIWSCISIHALSKWKAFASFPPRYVGAGLLVVCLAPLAAHYASRDESRNYLVEDYAKNVFRSVAQNGIVLSYQWDYWVSASYYFQYVEGLRRDVTVIDKELIRRSWYLKELGERYPWLTENSRRQL